MKLVENLFGPVGAISVQFHEKEAGILCRNGLNNQHTIFFTSLENGKRIEGWIKAGKLDSIQNVVPTLPSDQKELCISGIDSHTWNDWFPEEEEVN
jgi:hypothetical protein